MKLHRIQALLMKYWYISLNSLDRVFDIFYWPMIDLFLWGFASYYIESLADVNVLSMLIGGAVIWIFLWRSAQDVTVFVLEDFWSRNLYNLFTSPLRVTEMIIALVIFSTARAVVAFLFLIVMAYLLYSFSIVSIGYLNFALFVVLLMIFGYAVGLFITSFIFKYGSRIQVFAWSVVWILQPFSAVFYPVAALPPWAQKVAVILPTTYVFEAMRAVLNNTPIHWNGIIYSFVASLVLLVLVSIFLGRSIRNARKQGLLARYE